MEKKLAKSKLEKKGSPIEEHNFVFQWMGEEIKFTKEMLEFGTTTAFYEMTQKIAESVRNPTKAIIESSFQYNAVVAGALASHFKFKISERKDLLKKASVNISGTTVSFFMDLKRDTPKNRSIFFDMLEPHNENEILASYFKVHFYFISSGTTDLVGGSHQFIPQ